MNEAKGRASGRYRLLSVGVPLLLRQAWVWLSARVAEPPLRRVRDALTEAPRRKYQQVWAIPRDRPLLPLAG
jgi:hypothetical protein